MWAIILVEYAAVMAMNQGFFVYTLDDPYIHLALAQHILLGHYGVNLVEFSAPSSSVIWPFLLAPFSALETFPLWFNAVCASATLFFFYRIIDESFVIAQRLTRGVVITAFLVLFLGATNLIGLIFTGMEHSLQVLMVAIIAYGLVIEIKNKKVEPWLLVTMVLAPLVRYENLAVTLAAGLFLVCRRHGKAGGLAVLAACLLLTTFSFYLASLGLGIFPTSVLIKSSIVANGSSLSTVMDNLTRSLGNSRGKWIAMASAALAAAAFLMARKDGSRALATSAALAGFLHLVAGGYGWDNRYEIYIWVFLLLVGILLAGTPISRWINGGTGTVWKVASVIAAAGWFVYLSSFPYLDGLSTIPTAANNIYEQQYQMHRFTVEFYQKPVAVNDLGYVSYKNNQYVLDLWGLASVEAQQLRARDGDAQWMDRLAEEKNVELAMIYDGWFRRLPQNWIKVGELHLGKKRVTPAESTVAFYAMNENSKQEIIRGLQDFVTTLPKGVVFTFAK